MGMEREGGNGKIEREVSKMGIRGRQKDTGIYGMIKEELERNKLGERAGRRVLKREQGRRGRMSRQENV